jgi:diacylglycerol O-acyltransferase
MPFLLIQGQAKRTAGADNHSHPAACCAGFRLPPPAMKSHPMSAVDAAWYHFDGPVNTAVITSILITRKPLDFSRVRAVYAARLAQFERFRCRVVERGFPLASPHWEQVPGFEIEQQMHHVALPAPGDKAVLAALVSDLASTPLDRARPLWDVHVVDGVDGGSALITRMHHCIGDGTASVLVARALFDTSPGGWHGPAAAAAPRARARRLVERLFAPAIEFAESSYGQVRSAVDTLAAVVTHPQQSLEKAAVALAGAGMLAVELLRTPDPKSPLKGEFGLGKRVAWSEPVRLDDVKSIGAPMGAKINDVLVAGMTGALRAYLKKRRVDVDHMTVRAMVPVDLRPPGRASELGNEFGLVLLELAIRSRDPLARLRLTKLHMDELKRSPEPVAALALFGILGRVPKLAQDLAVRLFESKASVVMTNVAGPKEPLYLAGVPIDRFMFWVPYPGEELGMGISILSYKGYATLSVIADARLVPDPEVITERFHREFAAMQAAVRRREEKRAFAKAAARKAAAKTPARPAKRVRA